MGLGKRPRLLVQNASADINKRNTGMRNQDETPATLNDAFEKWFKKIGKEVYGEKYRSCSEYRAATVNLQKKLGKTDPDMVSFLLSVTKDQLHEVLVENGIHPCEKSRGGTTNYDRIQTVRTRFQHFATKEALD